MKNSINKFYENASYNQPHMLEAKISGYSDTFSIDLIGNDQKPDCKIGHFGYNFYLRTPRGLKFGKYKSLKTMFLAIKKVFKNNNLVVESIGIKKGWKYRVILS